RLFRGREADLALGPYLLLDRLGEGGMGVVYKARHRKLAQVVAVKVLRGEHLPADAARRFLREIRASARLSHPNVVLTLDADEADGVPFYSMEYVEGADLGKRVAGDGPLPVERACDCVR